MIELEFYIPLPPDETWNRLVQDNHIKKWWGKDVTLEPVKRGRFSESWTDEKGGTRHASGSVTAFENGSRLQLDYRSHEWARPMRVEFMLAPKKPGTQLYLQHSGWDAIPDETERKAEVDLFLGGWKELLENFVTYCSA